MDRLRSRERQSFKGFTQSEIEKMEKLRNEAGEESLNHKFCQKLARSFNCSSGRAGKPIVQWKQIQSWFQNKQQDCPAKITASPIAPKELVVLPDASVSNNAPESYEIPEGALLTEDITSLWTSDAASIATEVALVPLKWNTSVSSFVRLRGTSTFDYISSNTGEKVPDLSDLEFEARSSKDGAWYDVAAFLTHRVLSSGEPEVRVRFVGFGAEEDEWVNVKKAVRLRSLPLEPSECRKVKAGDLVLCFQERRDQAIYYDAHVVEVQRRLHDIRGCRCIFLVRYDHDNTEEKVRLRRICCRPH
ncbi:hypothetical protein HHK36_021677 [Tetracentron sinense]|uniref:SAWADEE domain-containing protein n=1 Tax=Tetracentron sinense TaxID=13715 RepID=A0A835D7K8_TETSI|nr:hypothetical protein HHK36_021677 [Tetracentron sinense]